MSNEISCSDEPTDFDSNKSDGFSQASLDIFKDMAIIDEGLRGIGYTLRQPAALRSYNNGNSRLQSETFYTAQTSMPDERPSGCASTPSDDSLVDIKEQSFQDDEDHGSLSVNMSHTASGYSVSSSDGTMQNLPLSADDIGTLCDVCHKYGPDRSYCNICELVYCETCWVYQPVHNKRRPANAIPHERTDHNVAKTIQYILSPDFTPNERERFHEDDVNATWFGVFRQKGELPLLREYGRYADIIDRLKVARSGFPTLPSSVSLHSDPPDEKLYPSLVSFVGETGAGKSTLIKLLIDLKSPEGHTSQTPIVGAAGRDIATSEDVHLYLDPESSHSRDNKTPILYADCEGLNGGGRDPVGARYRQNIEAMSLDRDDFEDELATTQLRLVSQRPLVWANLERRQSREFAVAQLYPRLLYAFSDVVVFVLKNPRVIEGVFERLLSWAEAALERSSNQPVLPCAIIALNASENGIQENLWDADQATLQLMNSLSEATRSNPAFKRYVDIWKARGQYPYTVEQLLWLYYRSVRVVRIPTQGRPNLIQQQVLKLYDEICDASKLSQRRKKNLRMLLDADAFVPYLQYALDHFAQSLDTAFDFVQASFAYCPIPMSLGGSILKLAIKIMDCWEDLRRAETIFEELSYVVASCIMLDMARNDIMGTPWRIFPRYIEHLDDALENFADRYWPCEYIGSGGLRCVNVRSGHQKGHQIKSGKLISYGRYQSTFSFEKYRDEFATDVYSKLGAIMSIVIKQSKSGRPELQSVTHMHRRILRAFFLHASCWKPELFMSNTICFACLMDTPTHVLPCGHILCTLCLMTFGTQRHNSVDIYECPVESSEVGFESTWTVQLKPENCGVRVLSLDGGGVRGLIQLEIIEEIERQLGCNLDIRKFFDLIVGIGTGGIVALGLSASDWKLQKCSEWFEALCNEAFTARVGSNVPVISKLIKFMSRNKYDTQPLLDRLQAAFTPHQYLFGGLQEDQSSYRTNVAVAAVSSGGKTVVLANYNRSCQDELWYHFQRSDVQQNEFKIWEAAYATFARDKFFKPFCHVSSNQTFSNRGIQHENPIKVAEIERRLIWPELEDEEPDLMVSIGTAYTDSSKTSTRDVRFLKMPSTPEYLQFMSQICPERNLLAPTNEEFKWNDYVMSRRSGRDLDRYVRVNVQVRETLSKFDDVHHIPRLKLETQHWKRDDPQIKNIAKRLVASCFYFDVDGSASEHQLGEDTYYEVHGNLRCRLISKCEVAGLGDFIQRNSIAGLDPYFLIQNEQGMPSAFRNESDRPKTVYLTTKIVERMKNEGLFRMDEALIIRSTTRSARTKFSICFDLCVSFPISRFPRCLHEDQSSGLATGSGTGFGTSVRWASRTYDQRQRMANWMPQSPRQGSEDSKIIERYCGTDHFLGRASGTIPVIVSTNKDNLKVNDESLGQSFRNSPGQHSSLVGGFEVAGEFYAPRARKIYRPTHPSQSPDAISTNAFTSDRSLPTLHEAASELMSNPIHELSASNLDESDC